MASGPAGFAPLAPVNHFIAGPPPPAVGSSHRLEERHPMSRRAWILSLGLITALGFASGARVALGPDGRAPVEASRSDTGVRTHDPLAGSVWIPAGSTASQRDLDVRPVMWVPASSTAAADERLRPRMRGASQVKLASLTR